jgi:hydrogenase 3 maturation protease
MMLILGVGNELRGDDAFGPLAVRELKKSGILANFWSGETPENFITSVREPVETLVILDTAELGKEPGTVELVDPDRINESLTSTHKLPLSLLIDHLKPGKTFFIAAQPKTLEFGARPSKEILKAVKKAKEIVLSL